MKTARAIAQLGGLWLLITLALCAAAAVLAPVDIAHPQMIYRSTT